MNADSNYNYLEIGNQKIMVFNSKSETIFKRLYALTIYLLLNPISEDDEPVQAEALLFANKLNINFKTLLMAIMFRCCKRLDIL